MLHKLKTLVITFGVLPVLFSAQVMAAPCDDKDFRAEYPRRCVPSKYNSWDFFPTPEFKEASESIDCPFWGSCLEAARDHIIKNVNDGITYNASTIQAAAKTSDQYSSTLSSLSKDRSNLQTNIPENDRAFQDRYAASLPESEQTQAKAAIKLYNESKRNNDIAGCLRDPGCGQIIGKLDDYKKSNLDQYDSKVSDVQSGINILQQDINASIDDFGKKVTGPFLTKGAKELNKIDGIVLTEQTLPNACGSILQNQSPGTTTVSPENLEKAKAICGKLEDEKDTIASVMEEFDKIKNGIDAESNLANLLGLKIDIQSGNAEQKALLNAELQKQAQGKLKGTVVGKMMDQMREDMCSVAQNPKALCTGASFGFKELVDDSSEITKEARDKFQSRIIGSEAVKN